MEYSTHLHHHPSEDESTHSLTPNLYPPTTLESGCALIACIVPVRGTVRTVLPRTGMEDIVDG